MDNIKITRKDLKRPDEFVLFTTKAYHFAVLNQMRIFYGLIAILVIIAGLVILQNYKMNRESKASNILFEASSSAREIFNNNTKDQIKPKLESREELFNKAITNFDIIIQKYSSTDSAVYANFYKGNLLFQNGKFDEAVNSFKNALKKLSNNERSKGLVLMNIGYSYEGLNNYQEALKFFEEASKLKLSPEKDLLYFKIAGCYLKIGKVAEAQKYYKMILTDYPNSKLIERVNFVLASKELM